MMKMRAMKDTVSTRHSNELPLLLFVVAIFPNNLRRSLLGILLTVYSFRPETHGSSFFRGSNALPSSTAEVWVNQYLVVYEE